MLPLSAGRMITAKEWCCGGAAWLRMEQQTCPAVALACSECSRAPWSLPNGWAWPWAAMDGPDDRMGTGLHTTADTGILTPCLVCVCYQRSTAHDSLASASPAETYPAGRGRGSRSTTAPGTHPATIPGPIVPNTHLEGGTSLGWPLGAVQQRRLAGCQPRMPTQVQQVTVPTGYHVTTPFGGAEAVPSTPARGR